uniref:Uncharacterized protein n=1 Tax=Escherichia phage vB_EcoM_4HA13 TaxID=2601675 RepID=A0A7D0J8A5_9CAUD
MYAVKCCNVSDSGKMASERKYKYAERFDSVNPSKLGAVPVTTTSSDNAKGSYHTAPFYYRNYNEH